MPLIKPYAQEINCYSDDRGTFVSFFDNAHMICGDEKKPTKRVYYIYSYGRHVVRGFHFHQHEWKNFIIVNGSAQFVALDPENPGEVFTFVSSSRKPNLVVIPAGYANGWMSLEDETILICASSSTLEESINDDIRFDPNKWGDVWTVKKR